MDMEYEIEQSVIQICLKMGWDFEGNREEMKFFIDDLLKVVRENYSNKLRGSYLTGYDHGMIDKKENYETESYCSS